MRRILELCVQLDQTAYDTYTQLAQSCEDSQLKTVFAQMAKEERAHVEWWGQVLEAWETGLVPDVADEHDLYTRLAALAEDVAQAVPDSCQGLSTDEQLDIAAHLEFYMLDPVFGELIDLTHPGDSVNYQEAYARHVMRLIDTIEERYSAQALAGFLARVLRRAYRDQQRLSSLATHDQLTGLLNRRGLMGYVRQWVSYADRYGRPVGVLLIDVDRFKGINDSLGHAAGDDALSAVSRALLSAVRTSDIVGRYGGDEFLVLAPETDTDELRLLMDRVVTTVRDAVLITSEGTLKLSVSVGGAIADGIAHATPEAVLATADRSLYAAKEAGRDRAGEPLPAGPAYLG